MKVTYTGFKELIDSLNLKAGKIRHAQGMLRKVAEAEVSEAMLRIDQTKLDPQGRPWAGWADSTAAARARDGTYDLGLLYHTGKMYNSFTVTINTNGSKVDVIIGNSAPYAGYVQDGTDKMPARPFLGWSEASKERIDTIMNGYIKEALSEGHL